MLVDYFSNITFGQPWFFLLLIIIPVMIFWEYTRGKKGVASIKMSSTEGLGKTGSLT